MSNNNNNTTDTTSDWSRRLPQEVNRSKIRGTNPDQIRMTTDSQGNRTPVLRDRLNINFTNNPSSSSPYGHLDELKPILKQKPIWLKPDAITYEGSENYGNH